MAENQTAATPGDGGAAPAVTGQTTATPQAPALAVPEWAANKYKDVPTFLDGMKNLQSLTDKKVAEYEAQIASLKSAQPAPAFDLKKIAGQIDSEFQSGAFSEDTKKFFSEFNIGEDIFKEVVAVARNKKLEPLKEHLGDTYDEAIKAAQSSLKPEEIDIFNSLLSSGKTRAAAAMVQDAYAAVQAKGNTPEVGTVSQSAGGGYKDFKEFYAASKDSRFNFDQDYQAQVRKKWEATPAALRDAWSKEYN